MRWMDKQRLALTTSIGLVCGMATGGLVGWQTARAPATLSAPSGSDRLAVSRVSLRPDTVVAPQVERQQGLARTREFEQSMTAMQGQMATLQAEVAQLHRKQAAGARPRAKTSALPQDLAIPAPARNLRGSQEAGGGPGPSPDSHD